MYGMIPSEKIAKFWSALPENRLRKPRMLPPANWSFSCLTALASTPGAGMCAPSR